MDCFKSAKVHPESLTTLAAREDSSDSELSESEIITYDDEDNTDSTEKKKDEAFSWDEFIEEFEYQVHETAGQKSCLYMLDGEPLKADISTGAGVHLITDEVMKTYGLEFLNLVADAVIDTFVDGKMKLGDIINELQQLDYTRFFEQKMVIWIEDEPIDTDPNLSFGRRLITELLTNKIEPQIMIPCNDLDEEVLYTIVKTLTGVPEPTEEEKAIASEGVYKIGLSLTMASNNCNLIVIDADRAFYDVPDYHNFMSFVEELGHQVLYLRNSPEIVDKSLPVEELVKKITTWQNKSKTAAVDTDNISNSEQDIEENSQEHKSTEAGEQSRMDQLVESLKNTEIIHKLTPAHFTLQDPHPTVDNDHEESYSEGEEISEGQNDNSV